MKLTYQLEIIAEAILRLIEGVVKGSLKYKQKRMLGHIRRMTKCVGKKLAEEQQQQKDGRRNEGDGK